MNNDLNQEYYNQNSNMDQDLNNDYNSVQSNEKLNNKFNKKNILLILLSIVIIGIGIFMIFSEKNLSNFDKKTSLTKRSSIKNNSDNITGKVDASIDLTYDENGAVLMYINDVFTISGRGTMVTGKIKRGTIKPGDEVQIIGLDQEIITTTVTALECRRENIEIGSIGEEIGVYLRGIPREQVKSGMAIVKPNSIVSAKKCKCQISILKNSENNDNISLHNNSKIQFEIDGVKIDGIVKFQNNKQELLSGDTEDVIITLDSSIALEKGMEFNIIQNRITISNGTVTEIYK